MPMIQVELFPGRSIEQKREWVEMVTRETCRIMKVDPEAVDVVFVEFEKHNRACGGKLWIDRKQSPDNGAHA